MVDDGTQKNLMIVIVVALDAEQDNTADNEFNRRLGFSITRSLVGLMWSAT